MLTDSQRRVLIVEDDEVLGRLMATLLADAGFRADLTASLDGVQGKYDLVVADYLAPAYVPGEPWPFLERLRALSGGAPILGCTGHEDATGDPLATLGVSAVLPKPFDVDEFVQTVELLVASSGQSAVIS